MSDVTLNLCSHKCHAVGLNPWVESCPVCGCANVAYDPNAEAMTFTDMHDYRRKQDEEDL